MIDVADLAGLFGHEAVEVIDEHVFGNVFAVGAAGAGVVGSMAAVIGAEDDGAIVVRPDLVHQRAEHWKATRSWSKAASALSEKGPVLWRFLS